MDRLSKMLKDSNGDPSSKRVAYIIVVIFAVGWLTAALVVSKGVITPLWFNVFGALLAAVTGGYVGGAALSEKKKTEAK